MHGSCISELSEFSTATSMVHKPNNWQNQFEWYLHAWNLCYFRSLLDSSSHCTVWKQNWMFSSCWVVFFTTNRKRKKRSSSVGQYEAPFINCLPSYLCQLNISHPKPQAFWIPDKRSFSGLKGIGGLVKPSKENRWFTSRLKNGVLGWAVVLLLIRKPLKKRMKINKQTYVKRLVWLSHPMDIVDKKLEVFWTIILGSSPYFNLQIAATSNLMVRCISVKWRLLKCTVIHPKDLS